MTIDQQRIDLFRSLFQGRNDVFAVRWEKGNKSGYMPSYKFDPYHYRLHKAKGGTLSNYPDKTYQVLTDDQMRKHLQGEQFLGIYPLMPDNSSFFIASDFDGETWLAECQKFINACRELDIPAYLERSRSGNGGHVWIFFAEAYAAFKSRRIVTSILETTGAFSIFDKASSFDRLFPNQDSLSGKGFGNLIAIPLHGKAIANGNNCFIDPVTSEPYPDQWAFLKTIKRISTAHLDRLFAAARRSDALQESKPASTLTIALANKINLNRNAIPLSLINFLKEELNFANSEFLIKKKLGKNTWGTQRNFKVVEEHDNQVSIPRGAIGKLLRFCKDNRIDYKFVDERTKTPPIGFVSNIKLKPHQHEAFEATTKKDFGVIVAPPGSGKTVLGLSIIADKMQPALIIVHRKQLADQWIERIETFLGIQKRDIGKVSAGKAKVGRCITVAMVQSLNKIIDSPEGAALRKAFGTIIIDECHHVPAECYRNTISKLYSFYLYGLTATPFRKYNDGKLIFIHIGDVISEVKSSQIENQPRARIIVRNTGLAVPFNYKTDKFETLSKILVHDSLRNKQIIEDVIAELNVRKKVVIISERKDHIDTLNQYLKQFYETVALSGEDSEQSRNTKWRLLKDGHFQVLITTGQYFGEGTDLSNISTVFLVYPFSFEGKLIQYIGRVQRSEIAPTIYDYRDYKIPYLEMLFQKRNVFYRKLYREGTLFDQQDIPDEAKNVSTVEVTVKVPIESLIFGFGVVSFKYTLAQVNSEAEFEVENREMRPEFEVLKPYFAKYLKTKSVKVNLVCKIEQSKLKSYVAFSSDLDKINRELVEAVRFRFVRKNLVGRIPDASSGGLLDIDGLQDSAAGDKLFKSGEELLDEILKLKDARHYHQLRYLAERHDRGVLKVRFVLLPFSFVFLLTGREQYHVVWETLDTEEATYIWHVDKNKALLKGLLRKIDHDLNLIRAKGRQAFIDRQPDSFSKILHDYTDLRRGLIIWKDQMQSRLV